MPLEIKIRLWKIAFDGRASVTTSSQQLKDIFSGLPEGESKTITITNFGTSSIYYAADASKNSTTAGGILKPSSSLEISIGDLNLSPYFMVEAGTVVLGLVVWD